MSFFKPKSDKAKPPAKVPWTEKYRPQSLADVASQDAIVSVLEKTLHGNLPHMLFYGPPGTGKTSTVLALARELYGPELVKSRVLELNASDDRGIAVVRDRIKTFSKTLARQSDSAPAFKLVILDEADMMTQDAQAALRRTMETFARTTRFCLICNYVTRIIDPLASRCSKFRFKPVDSDSAFARLKEICELESVELESDDVLTQLLKTTEGDLRRSITLLQSAAGFKTVITTDLVNELAGIVPQHVVKRVLGVVESGNQKQVETVCEELVLEGYSVHEILVELHDACMASAHPHKPLIAATFSLADKRLADGSDEHIELLNIVSRLAQV